jgi:Peptidase U49
MPDTVQLMAPYLARLEHALLAIAPERNDELVREVFKGRKWHLTAVSGAPVAGIAPFKAVLTNMDIEVSSSGLAMLWCISASAGLALDVVKSANSQRGGEINVGAVFSKMQPFINHAMKLRTHDVQWPDDLQRRNPASRVEPFETIDRIVFGAASWILLHEVAHIHFQHESNLLPVEMIKQEDEADKFAARWVFEKVHSYREREFRILAVGVAVAWLLLFEPVGGDPKHPPAVNRMMHIASYFGAKSDSVALEVVAHLLKILFFPTKSLPDFASAQTLFDWTVELFR